MPPLPARVRAAPSTRGGCARGPEPVAPADVNRAVAADEKTTIHPTRDHGQAARLHRIVGRKRIANIHVQPPRSAQSGASIRSYSAQTCAKRRRTRRPLAKHRSTKASENKNTGHQCRRAPGAARAARSDTRASNHEGTETRRPKGWRPSREVSARRSVGVSVRRVRSGAARRRLVDHTSQACARGEPRCRESSASSYWPRW